MSVEDLPVEILRKIFNHLTYLRDLVACGSVCRRWKRVYECHFQLKKLTVTEKALEKLDFKERIDKLEKRKCFFVLIEDWPRLTLRKRYQVFTLSLKMLTIDISSYKLAEPFKIRMPFLKVLIFLDTNYGNRLEVYCPTLKHLVYKECQRTYRTKKLLEVYWPNSIKILNTNLYDQQLEKFRNTKILISDSIATLESARKLKQLEEFHFKIDWYQFPWGFQRFAINREEFVSILNKISRNKLKITFAGFRMKITDGENLKNFIWKSSDDKDFDDETFYWMNTESIDAIAFNYRKHWFYRDGMSPELAVKLKGVERLNVFDGAANESAFMEFARELKSLRELDANGILQSSNFYNSIIPKVAPRLRSLRLVGMNHISLNFLMKLPELVSIEILSKLNRIRAAEGLEWIRSGGTKEFAFDNGRSFFLVVIQIESQRIMLPGYPCDFFLTTNFVNKKPEHLLDLCYSNRNLPRGTSWEDENQENSK